MPTKKISKVEATLPRIAQWCEHGKLSEKSLESLLLLDLFQDALKYEPNRATSQTPIAGGIADIALRTHLADKKRWVVIEVKKLTVTISDDTVRQAARYLLDLGATRGIVTNGKVWLFIRVRPKSDTLKVNYADVLMRCELGKTKTSSDRRLLLCALSRCTKLHIEGFFEMLEAFYDIGKHDIQSIVKTQPPTNWVAALTTHVRKTSKKKIEAGNTAVFRTAVNNLGLFPKAVTEAYQEIKLFVP